MKCRSIKFNQVNSIGFEVSDDTNICSVFRWIDYGDEDGIIEHARKVRDRIVELLNRYGMIDEKPIRHTRGDRYFVDTDTGSSLND